MMPDPSHHQGSRSLSQYEERWVCQIISLLQCSILQYCNPLMILFLFQSPSHGGQPVNTFQAYAMSHKGKGRVTSGAMCDFAECHDHDTRQRPPSSPSVTNRHSTNRPTMSSVRYGTQQTYFTECTLKHLAKYLLRECETTSSTLKRTKDVMNTNTQA